MENATLGPSKSQNKARIAVTFAHTLGWPLSKPLITGIKLWRVTHPAKFVLQT